MLTKVARDSREPLDQSLGNIDLPGYSYRIAKEIKFNTKFIRFQDIDLEWFFGGRGRGGTCIWGANHWTPIHRRTPLHTP